MIHRPAPERFMLTVLVEGGRMPLNFFVHTAEDLRKLLLAIEEAQLGQGPTHNGK